MARACLVETGRFGQAFHIVVPHLHYFILHYLVESIQAFNGGYNAIHTQVGKARRLTTVEFLPIQTFFRPLIAILFQLLPLLRKIELFVVPLCYRVHQDCTGMNCGVFFEKVKVAVNSDVVKRSVCLLHCAVDVDSNNANEPLIHPFSPLVRVFICFFCQKRADSELVHSKLLRQLVDDFIRAIQLLAIDDEHGYLPVIFRKCQLLLHQWVHLHYAVGDVAVVEKSLYFAAERAHLILVQHDIHRLFH
mmetsp:Transcript_12359/g.33109  ORF Transcript_12359/g.33109 Transcript_12359/m.33109 type:complete len:248 (-) Transcript_12359:240-983(-)